MRRPFTFTLVLVLFAACGVLLRGAQPWLPPALALGDTARLTPAEAERLATEARARLNVELADGVDLSLWAPRELLVDPVAIDVAADGTLYATSSMRNNMPLDIRQHPDWMTPVHALRTLADLRAFYRRVMAPGNSEINRWIDDLNGDGVRDIRDMEPYKERIYRLRDTDGDGRADESRVVYEGFNDDPAFDILGGILAHEGDVIAGVPPGVYRLHDSDGDGILDRRTTIAEGMNIHPAFGGHGVSGVIIGPDGRLYWEVGDIGLHVVDEHGKTWAMHNQGAVMRSEIDGSNFEVFATGIRNLQEFSFDDRGNLISVDNDGDHAGEMERLVYLPYGSDSGWRSNWQYGKYTDPKNNRYNVWMRESLFKPRGENTAAHVLAPIENWHAGPSGMAYNPGTALSEAWNGYFFVSSFPGAAPNARVYGFTLAPDGAGFRKDVEKTLTRGVLVVGMKFGPDGALYITDWITGWDSKDDGRLWKLDTPATAGSAIRKEVQTLLVTDFAQRPAASIDPLLRHADMRIRQKAQFDLVRRGDVQALLAAARDRSSLHGRLHGLWGLAQASRRQSAIAAELVPFLADDDAEIRAQAARLVGDVKYAAAGERLLPLLADASPRVRFFATEAAGRLAYRPAVPGIIAMLAADDGRDQWLHHTGAGALATIGEADALVALSSHASRGVRSAAVVALRRMHHPGVARFLADVDASVVIDAARAINDDGGIAGAIPDLAALLDRAPITNEPLVRRAINANFRVGTAAAVARIEAVARNTSAPADIRAEAASALGVWDDPSPTDRVDGYYHGTVTIGDTTPRTSSATRRQTRDIAAARAAIERLVVETARGTSADDADVKVALAEAAGRLDARGAMPTLHTQLSGDPSAPVRVAALRGLQAMKVGDKSALMQSALGDSDATVRRAALALLPDLRIPAAAKANHAATLLKSGGIQEQQGAIEVLGALKSIPSRRLLAAQLDELDAGRLPPELHIDLLDAVQTDGNAALAARLDAYQRRQQADMPIKAFRTGAVTGGNARRGQQVFSQNPLAECTRCHAIRGRGADVGPDLSRIGATLTRDQLFESLVDPNVRIAPGFGTVGVTLRNGERLDGTLKEETDSELVLVAGAPAVTHRIPKADIAERTNPISAMPPLGLILKPRDVRDLIEFLSGLR